MVKQLYIAKHPYSSLVKIGMSDNPIKRLNGLKNTVGGELQLLYESVGINEPAAAERLVHSKFKEYRTAGEWFLIEDINVVIEFIESILPDFEKGEYKDLLIGYELGNECVEMYEYAISNRSLLNPSYILTTYKEVEDKIYESSSHWYYVIYIQGKLKRTARFCNLALAKKFKKDHIKRVIAID